GSAFASGVTSSTTYRPEIRALAKSLLGVPSFAPLAKGVRLRQSPTHRGPQGSQPYRCTNAIISGVYLAPTTPIPAILDSKSCFSRGDNVTFSAPILSSRYFSRFVPGIGTTSLLCANTQANANCADVHPFFAAISFTASANLRFAS